MKAFILVAGFLTALLAGFLAAVAPAVARDGVVRPQARWLRPQYAPLRRPPPPPAIAIPQQFAPPQEAFASFPTPLAAGGGPASGTAEPSPCQLRLGKLATFKPLPVLVGPGECVGNHRYRAIDPRAGGPDDAADLHRGRRRAAVWGLIPRTPRHIDAID